MKKSLKKIELNDISEVASMLKIFWKSQDVDATDSDVLEDIGRMLNSKRIAFLICLDDQIAGFIFINDKYGYINNIEYLFVKEEFRGLGLASFTLEEVKKYVLMRKNPKVQIEVAPTNKRALNLYYKHGFTSIDTITLATDIIGKSKEVEVFGKKFLVNSDEVFEA